MRPFSLRTFIDIPLPWRIQSASFSPLGGRDGHLLQLATGPSRLPLIAPPWRVSNTCRHAASWADSYDALPSLSLWWLASASGSEMSKLCRIRQTNLVWAGRHAISLPGWSPRGWFLHSSAPRSEQWLRHCFSQSLLDDFWGFPVRQEICNSGELGLSTVVVGEFYERTAAHQLERAWTVWLTWIHPHGSSLHGCEPGRGGLYGWL